MKFHIYIVTDFEIYVVNAKIKKKRKKDTTYNITSHTFVSSNSYSKAFNTLIYMLNLKMEFHTLDLHRFRETREINKTTINPKL